MTDEFETEQQQEKKQQNIGDKIYEIMYFCAFC